MLFARLQREAQRPRPGGILGNAHQPAGHDALEFILGGHKRGMGTAIAHRYAKPLTVAHRYIGAKLAWRAQQGQRQQVGGDDHQRPGGVRFGAERFIIQDRPVGGWVLEKDAKGRLAKVIGRIVIDHHFIAKRQGTRAHHVDGLRMTAFVNKKSVGGHVAGLGAAAQGHCLGGSGRFIEHGGIGNGHAGQFHDHGLEIEQRFQPALRDFSLVGGILGVPTGVFQNVAQNDAGGQGAIIAHADKGTEALILVGQGAQIVQYIGFRAGAGQLQFSVQANALRHGFVNQGIERGYADRCHHAGNVLFARPQVAVDKVILAR